MSETELISLSHEFARLFDEAMDADEARDLLIRTSEGAALQQAIAPAAAALHARLAKDGLAVRAPANAIDVCGTGGDGHHTVNISTAVAIVVAACGVPVAKHGNRAATSLAGGADTLEALGLDLGKASARAEESLADLGIGFMFAQRHHPALRWLGPIRQAIARPTVLNCIGPLCNPAGVRRQLIGLPNASLFAHFSALPWATLGLDRVMVVTGAEGLDEISIAGPSDVYARGFTAARRVVPEDAGLPRHSLGALKGGDAAYNAAALRRLLQGEQSAYRDAVLLNAAGALIVAGEVNGWRDGAEEAAEAIDKGLAKALLDCWIAFVK